MCTTCWWTKSCTKKTWYLYTIQFMFKLLARNLFVLDDVPSWSSGHAAVFCNSTPPAWIEIYQNQKFKATPTSTKCILSRVAILYHFEFVWNHFLVRFPFNQHQRCTPCQQNCVQETVHRAVKGFSLAYLDIAVEVVYSGKDGKCLPLSGIFAGTLPETNIYPDNWSSQKEIHLPTIDFQWLC